MPRDSPCEGHQRTSIASGKARLGQPAPLHLEQRQAWRSENNKQLMLPGSARQPFAVVQYILSIKRYARLLLFAWWESCFRCTLGSRSPTPAGGQATRRSHYMVHLSDSSTAERGWTFVRLVSAQSPTIDGLVSSPHEPARRYNVRDNTSYGPSTNPKICGLAKHGCWK